MTIQHLKQLIKESIEEVIEESSCPVCGESVYETECECVKEETDLDQYKDVLQQQRNQLK